MKKLLVSLVLLVGLLGACSSQEVKVKEEPAEEEKEVEEVKEEPKEESKEEPKEKKEAPLGTFANPIPYGETALIESGVYDDDGNFYEAEFQIKVSNVQRGGEVMQFLLEQNQFNDPAPEGYEWLMFDIEYTAKIEDPSVPDYVAPSFNVFDSSGSPINQFDLYATFADGNEFGWVDVYDGGSTSGKVAVIVPIGEPVVIEYFDFNTEFFFAVE